MFSSRIDWKSQPNAISSRVETMRAAGVPLLDLTISNPTHAGFAYPESAILDALSDPRSLGYEPSPRGLAGARASISGYYAQRRLQVSPDRILLTASTSEAYAFAFKLLANAGDEILTPCPSYPLFEFLASLENVRTVPYPLIYDRGWFIDFGALEAAVHARTRAIAIVNPNNPTGSFLKKEEWARLASFCQQRQIAVLSDEVFADYSFGDDPERVSSLAAEKSGPLTIAMSGLSKIAGLPQLKLGWMAVSGDPALAEKAIDGLELIADTYLSVGATVQHAAPCLLDLSGEIRRQIQERTQRNLSFLNSRAGRFQVLDVEGGWYTILQVPRIRTEEEWVLLLLDRYRVLVHPGFFFDFHAEAYLVVSLLAAPETFEEGVTRISKCCS